MKITDMISDEKKKELDNFWAFLYGDWFINGEKFDNSKCYALPF